MLIGGCGASHTREAACYRKPPVSYTHLDVYKRQELQTGTQSLADKLPELTKGITSLVNDKDIFNSRILLDLKNIIEHQLELRNIGLSLSETIQTCLLYTSEMALIILNFILVGIGA